jgi:hypothetical protein
MRSGRASRPRPSARHRAASYPREVSPFLLKPPSTANCSKSKGDKVWYSAKRPGRSTGRHEIGFPLSRPDRQKRQWRQARDAREVAIKRINMSGIYDCQQGWSVRVDWGKRRPAASETRNSFVLSRSGGTPLPPVIVLSRSGGTPLPPVIVLSRSGGTPLPPVIVLSQSGGTPLPP